MLSRSFSLSLISAFPIHLPLTPLFHSVKINPPKSIR